MVTLTPDDARLVLFRRAVGPSAAGAIAAVYRRETSLTYTIELKDGRTVEASPKGLFDSETYARIYAIA